MELWDVLDKNGNKTGEVIEKQDKLPEGYYHLGAEIWIMNSKKEILIQKRSSKKKIAPNKWAMTGGSVIAKETSIQTIRREVKEELGIEIKLKDIQFLIRYKLDNLWIDTYLLKQDIDLKDIKIEKEEVSAVKWVKPEEIDKLVQNKEFMELRWEKIGKTIKKM